MCDIYLLIFQAYQLNLLFIIDNKIQYIFVNLIDSKANDRLLIPYIQNNYSQC
jgi:hypothetical protein